MHEFTAKVLINPTETSVLNQETTQTTTPIIKTTNLKTTIPITTIILEKTILTTNTTTPTTPKITTISITTIKETTTSFTKKFTNQLKTNIVDSEIFQNESKIKLNNLFLDINSALNISKISTTLKPFKIDQNQSIFNLNMLSSFPNSTNHLITKWLTLNGIYIN